MPLRAPDFESGASADSAIPATEWAMVRLGRPSIRVGPAPGPPGKASRLPDSVQLADRFAQRTALVLDREVW